MPSVALPIFLQTFLVAITPHPITITMNNKLNVDVMVTELWVILMAWYRWCSMLQSLWVAKALSEHVQLNNDWGVPQLELTVLLDGVGV